MAEAQEDREPPSLLQSVCLSTTSSRPSTTGQANLQGSGNPGRQGPPDERCQAWVQDHPFNYTRPPSLPTTWRSSMSDNSQVDPSETVGTMLEHPFRTPPLKWDRLEKADMQEILGKKKPPHGIPFYNILLLGSIGVGKTTFANTLLSVLSGKHNTSLYTAANSDKSVTKEVQIVPLYSDIQLPIYTYDIRGYELANETNPDAFPPHKADVEHILNGEIKEGYKLQQDCIRHGDKHYDPAGCEDRKIHVVVLMTDVATITRTYFDKNVLTNYEEVLTIVREKKIQVVVIVNKVDNVPGVNTDLKKVFYSEKLRQACDDLSSLFGVSPDDVLFQMNCQNMSSLTPELSCLTLSNLLHILEKADVTITSQKGKPVLSARKLLPAPWRTDLGVTQKDKADACAYLKNVQEPMYIILMGLQSAGKTQFINSAQAAIKDRTLVLTLDTGRRDRPVTTKLQHFKVADDVKVTLIDTTSLSPDKQNGMHEDDVKATLEGRIPDGYAYNCLESCKWTEKPYPVHVAAFVINGKTFRENPAEVQEVKRAIQVAKQTEPKKLVAVLVTHVADLQPGIDAANVYHCQEVKHCIDEVFESFGECDIQNMDILPICNYTSKDSGLTDAKSAIILQSLKHLCERAESLLPPPPPAPAASSKPEGWINWLTGK